MSEDAKREAQARLENVRKTWDAAYREGQIAGALWILGRLGQDWVRWPPLIGRLVLSKRAVDSAAMEVGLEWPASGPSEEVSDG